MNHRIRKISFFIDTNSDEVAFWSRPILSNLIYEKYYPIIERVFDELAIPENIVRINQLNIDIGDVYVHEFERSLPRRFHDALYDALLKLFINIRQQRQGPYTLLHNSAAELEILEIYLLHGRLPWWAGHDYSFSRLFESVLGASGQRLVEMIRRISVHDHIFKRLAFLLNDKTLIRFIKQMNLSADRFIINYVLDLTRAHRITPLVKGGLQEFKQVVWQLVLSYLLLDRGTQFNKKTFVKWNIEHIAAQYGLRYDELLLFLIDSISKTAGHFSFQSSFTTIIKNLGDEYFKEGPADPVEMEYIDAFGILKKFLELGIETSVDSDTSIAAIFSKLVAISSDSVRHLLMATGQRKIIQQKIWKYLPVNEVVDLIEPVEHVFINSYAAVIITAHRADPVINAPAAELEREVWSLILNYLMNDRGTDFNRKTFLKWNLVHIANKYNITYEVLLSFISRSFETIPQNLKMKGTLPAIFNKLITEERLYNNRKKPSAEASSVAKSVQAEAARVKEKKMTDYLLLNRRPIGSGTNDMHQLLEEYLIKDPIQVGGFIRKFMVKAKLRKLWVNILPANLLKKAMRIAGFRGIDNIWYWAELFAKTYNSPIYPGSFTFLKNPEVFVLEYLNAFSRSTYQEQHFVRYIFANTAREAGNSRALLYLSQVIYQQTIAGLANAKLKMLTELYDEIKRYAPNSSLGHNKAGNHATGLKTAFTLESDFIGTPLYITNAGLILIGVYLPGLFKTLALTELAEVGRWQFKDEHAAFRAVHLMHYIVYGNAVAEEHQLTLNKLLSGLPLYTPVNIDITISEYEKDMVNGLLASAVKNWPAIQNTSIDGLRSFFLREGKLIDKEGKWELEVENKTVDILIDQLPWSIFMIKEHWMQAPLYIKWRK